MKIFIFFSYCPQHSAISLTSIIHCMLLSCHSWVFVYELSGCGFKSRCCQHCTVVIIKMNWIVHFYLASFEQFFGGWPYVMLDIKLSCEWAKHWETTEAFSEPCQTSKIELFSRSTPSEIVDRALNATLNSSVTSQMGESQNGCLKKTKHVKFSKKRTFLTPWYVRVRKGVFLWIFQNP